jgi:hypothetical protein
MLFRSLLGCAMLGVTLVPATAQYADQGPTTRLPCSYITNQQVIERPILAEFLKGHFVSVARRWEEGAECLGAGVLELEKDGDHATFRVQTEFYVAMRIEGGFDIVPKWQKRNVSGDAH